MATRGERSVVASLGALQILGLTLLAHAVAGGGTPGWGFVFGLVPIVVAVCWAAGRRLLTVRTSAAALVVLQLGLHLVLQAGAADAHVVHGTGTTLQMGGASLTWAMLAAHVVSGLVAAVVLSAQRRALLALRRRLAWPGVAATPRRTTAPPALTVRHAALPLALRPHAPRRGPPVPLAPS